MDRNYINVLDYSESDLLALLRNNNHLVRELSNYSFLRQTNSIYVDLSYDDCIKSNYIAFQNPAYSNKWWFAWIDEVIYKGDKNCEITYTIDAWSTFYNDITKQSCYVLREHVANDTIGANTEPEDLAVDEVICEHLEYDTSYDEYYWVGVLTNYDPYTQSNYPTPFTQATKNIFAKKLVLFDTTYTDENYQNDGLIALGLFLQKTNADGKADEIDSVFFIPSAGIHVPSLESHTITATDYVYYTMDNLSEGGATIQQWNHTMSKHYTFTGYTPKNNKCFCYPYNYLYVTNNQGNFGVFKYEDFSTSNVNFKNEFSISIGGSGKIYPLNYKGMSDYDSSIPLPKYPTIAYSSDAFINWCTQNAVNVPSQLFNTGISIGQSVTSGNYKEGVTSGLGTALDLIGKFYKASLLPDSTSGQNTGDIDFLAGRNTFCYRCMRAKNEYIRIIDDFFTRYGYKINRLKVPATNSRTYWNYIQISSDSNIGYGNVPDKYMTTINEACRRGTTIWHNHGQIGHFDLTNSIV